MVVGLFMHVLVNNLFYFILRLMGYEDGKVTVTIFIGQIEMYQPYNWTLMIFFLFLTM